MIQTIEKSNCCGCEACVQICPKHCIDFKQDREGFFYPNANTETCISCGLCEKVCPVINQGNTRGPIHSYAAKNNCEDERLQSSSGGIFILLAKKTIVEGGVVFGARFDDNWTVIHSYTETIEGIKPFLGSKYVQSRIGDSYIKVREFLQADRNVLFSGTPCQIAGLKRYLCKDYDNLLTVDFICHGVPSPAVWRQYLEEIKENARKGENTVSFPHNPPISGSDALAGGRGVEIESIAFRDKRLGWKKYSFALTLAEAIVDGKKNTVSLSFIHYENLFMKAFLSNLILRPSCYSCPSKGGRSNADITIADFWGIDKVNPQMDDDRGTSLVLINTEKGANALKNVSLIYAKVQYKDIAAYNPSISISAIRHPLRDVFFQSFSDTVDLHQLISKCLRPTIKQLIKQLFNMPYIFLSKIKAIIGGQNNF